MGRRAEGPGSAWGPPGWKSSVQAALLAASILNSHVLLTQATIRTETEIVVTWTPSQPQTGDNLTLTPGGAPKKLLSCSWYRGWTTAKEKMIVSSSFFPVPRRKEGHSHTGRETAGPNCSLQIRNLTALDSGNYTVTKKGLFSLETGHAYVEVSDPTRSKLSPGIISGIILGLLLAVMAGIGAFLYFFFRGQNQGSWWGTQPPGPILDPSQPVSNIYQSNETTEAVSTYSAYEYVYPSAQAEPQTQVRSGSSLDTSQRYQTLQVQCGSQELYHDLRKPHHLPPPGSSSWLPLPS